MPRLKLVLGFNSSRVTATFSSPIITVANNNLDFPNESLDFFKLNNNGTTTDLSDDFLEIPVGSAVNFSAVGVPTDTRNSFNAWDNFTGSDIENTRDAIVRSRVAWNFGDANSAYNDMSGLTAAHVFDTVTTDPAVVKNITLSIRLPNERVNRVTTLAYKVVDPTRATVYVANLAGNNKTNYLGQTVTAVSWNDLVDRLSKGQPVTVGSTTIPALTNNTDVRFLYENGDPIVITVDPKTDPNTGTDKRLDIPGNLKGIRLLGDDPAAAKRTRIQFDDGSGTGTFTANSATDICAHSNAALQHLTRVLLTTTGVVPGGLTANTDYWVIRLSANTFKLAKSYADAVNGIGINLTSTGSGANTLTVRSWAYYVSSLSDFDDRDNVRGRRAITLNSNLSTVRHLQIEGVNDSSNPGKYIGAAFNLKASGTAINDVVGKTVHDFAFVESNLNANSAPTGVTLLQCGTSSNATTGAIQAGTISAYFAFPSYYSQQVALIGNKCGDSVQTNHTTRSFAVGYSVYGNDFTNLKGAGTDLNTLRANGGTYISYVNNTTTGGQVYVGRFEASTLEYRLYHISHVVFDGNRILSATSEGAEGQQRIKFEPDRIHFVSMRNNYVEGPTTSNPILQFKGDHGFFVSNTMKARFNSAATKRIFEIQQTSFAATSVLRNNLVVQGTSGALTGVRLLTTSGAEGATPNNILESSGVGYNIWPSGTVFDYGSSRTNPLDAGSGNRWNATGALGAADGNDYGRNITFSTNTITPDGADGDIAIPADAPGISGYAGTSPGYSLRYDIDGLTRPTGTSAVWTAGASQRITAAPGAPSTLTRANETPSGWNYSATPQRLTWTQNSTNEASFILQRDKHYQGQIIETVQFVFDEDETTFLDLTVADQSFYTYKVKASNSVGDSAFSNVV